MTERRREARYPVSWPVRLWFDDAFCLSGHAIDASAHGILVTLFGPPARALQPDAACRVEIYPGTRFQLNCSSAIRNLRERAIGLEIPDGLAGGFEPAGRPPRLGAAHVLSSLAAAISHANRSLSDLTRPSTGDRLGVLAFSALHDLVAGEQDRVRDVLKELALLVRFLVRFGELSPAECQSVKDMSALGRILVIDDRIELLET